MTLNGCFGHLFIPALELSRLPSLWSRCTSGMGPGHSEKPYVQALQTVDSTLFSLLNLDSATESVGNLLFGVLSSLNRAVTQPHFSWLLQWVAPHLTANMQELHSSHSLRISSLFVFCHPVPITFIEESNICGGGESKSKDFSCIFFQIHNTCYGIVRSAGK